MNRAQIVDLLTYCAACDQRTVGETDVAVWFDQLAPIDFERALEAARQHYRRQPDVRLKPGHIWMLCKTVTDVDAADRALTDTTCDHGRWHRECGQVHHDDEPCSVLVTKPALRELLATVIKEV
jgi:hypothetical protein